MNRSGSGRMENELVLDLREFFWRLLEQWKAVLIFVLIVILLLSGLMYARNSAAEIPASDEVSVKTMEDILSSLSTEDQEVVIGVLQEQENLDNLREYVYSSPFMSLDPYRINTLKIKVLINSDDEINKQLAAAYGGELTSSTVAGAISTAWNNVYSADQVSELLTTLKEISIDTEAKLAGNIVTLSVFLPDEMNAELAMDAVENCLPEIRTSLSKSIGEHTAKIIGSDVQVISDQDASLKQYDTFVRLYNMIYHINYINGLMTAEQKDAFQSLVNYEEKADTDEIVPESEPVKPDFFTKKSIVVGFILGCFLYVCIYLLLYIFSDRILSSAYLESFYGTRIIGEWYSGKSKGLEWLFKSPIVFKLHHKGHLDVNSEAKRACETICSLIDKDNGGNVLVISSEEDNAFIKLLTEELDKNNANVALTAVKSSDGIYLSESTIKENDVCALVADEKKTTKRDVKDVYDKCSMLNTKFAGTIYLG